MTPAVAYMRCSGLSQVEGDTWHRQLAAIRSYALANGLELVAEYRDEAVSGKTELENRPGLGACLERIENNGVKVVLVESADRLARDSLVAEVIIRQFQKAGGKVIAASGGVDLTEGDDTNPTAKLIRQILASVAEFDRCVTVLKLRAARERIKAKTGRCEGVKPYGEGAEAVTLDLMADLRERGMTYKAVAAFLNANGHRTRSGGFWFDSTVHKILTRSNNAK